MRDANTDQQDPLLSLRDISRHFQEGDHRRDVIKHLNLTLNTDESVALLGRSGCGKSTLLNLIAGIDIPDEGEIWFDGTNMVTSSEYDRTLMRRKNIGFVYQFFNLIPTLTVEENILIPLELNHKTASTHREYIHELLARIDLTHKIKQYPDRLSGGEQQRVAIIRALIHKPRLVLADEPTGNLDAESGKQVLDLLDELISKNGASLIVVTHSLAVAQRCKTVLTLEGGKLDQDSSRLSW